MSSRTVGHRGAGHHAIEDLRHVLGRETQLPRLVLVDLDLEHPRRLVPVVEEVAQLRTLAQHAGQGQGLAAYLGDVRAADAVLNRPPTGGPISSGWT